MFPRPFRPPLWFELALTAALAALLHACGLHSLESPPVLLGFWGFVAAIAGWIWKGVSAAATATIPYLQWAVAALWTFGKSVYNTLVALGGTAMRGIGGVWRFMRATYTHVLRPAWVKFWKLIDTVRDTLDRVLGPIFTVLRRIREEILEIYDRFVRPVLDAIGIARKVLRVFSTLGLDWARALDRKLGELEQKIDAPFRLALRHINQLVNVVNRVVTADGLFQRLALVRSIERDIRYVQNAWWNAFHRPATADEAESATAEVKTKSIREHVEEFRAAVRGDGSALAARIDEETADLRLELRRAR